MCSKRKKLLDQIQTVIDRMDRIESILSNLAENRQGPSTPVSVSEIAKYLKLSVSTVYSKVSKNEIPFQKVGKRLYFYLPEIDNWIRSNGTSLDEIERKALDYLDLRKQGL